MHEDSQDPDPAHSHPDADPEYFHLETAPPPPKDHPFVAYWKKVGGGSLSVSILVHAAIIIAALLWLFPPGPGSGGEENVDFLSGGGGGTSGNTKIEKQRRRMMVASTPSVRIAGSATNGSIALPDTTASLVSSSMLTAAGQMGGTPGSGGGWGGGQGTGRGTGMGSGMGPGKSPGFTARFLGLESSGNNIIFCVDVSGSMRINLQPAGISALRRELGRAIEALPPSAEFNIICFASDGDIFKPKSISASADNKKEAIEFLKGYYGDGNFGRTRSEKFGRKGKDDQGTDFVALKPEDVEELAGTTGGSRIDLAMVAAFDRQPSTVFVLSDGAPGTRRAQEDNPIDKDDLIDLIAEKQHDLMKTPVKVNTITADSNTPDAKEGAEFMRNLARKFEGRHKVVKLDRVN